MNPNRECQLENRQYDHSKHWCYKWSATDTRTGIRCNQCSNIGVRGGADLRAGWNCNRCGYWLCQECFSKFERQHPSLNAHEYNERGERRLRPVGKPARPTQATR